MRKGEGCWEKQPDPMGASHWIFRLCPYLPPHLAVTHRVGSTSNCGSFLISTFCQDLLVLLLSDLSHHLYPCVFSDHMSLESSFSLAQSCHCALFMQNESKLSSLTYPWVLSNCISFVLLFTCPVIQPHRLSFSTLPFPKNVMVMPSSISNFKMERGTSLETLAGKGLILR